MVQSFKKVLLLALAFFPFSVLAEEAKSPFDEIEYINSIKENKVKKTPEEILTYIRLGKSVNSSGKNESALMGSIGYKRIPDQFSYGFEYSYHVIENRRANDYSFTLGYKPSWNHKVVPYVQAGFGLVSYSDINSYQGNSSSGIAYFYDIGLETFSVHTKVFQFKTMVGIKNTSLLISGYNKIGFDDLYLMVGVGW